MGTDVNPLSYWIFKIKVCPMLLEYLPNDIFEEICSYVNIQDLLPIRCVCRKCKYAIDYHYMWSSPRYIEQTTTLIRSSSDIWKLLKRFDTPLLMYARMYAE